MVRTPHVNDDYADPEQFHTWAGSAVAILEATFGKSSHYCESFKKSIGPVGNYVWSTSFRALLGIFRGAKNDVDGDYLFNLQQSVSGEVFADFVVTAKAALVEGNHTVACVLACAALEDALKRFAVLQGLQVDGQTMENVINALKSKGLVSGARKPMLAAMPKIRNYAMHADWDKISAVETASVIGFVEQFLLSNF